MNIVKANSRHLSEINKIIRAVNLLPEMADTEGCSLWVAKDGGKVVGVVALERHGTKVAVIHRLAVYRHLWHRGIGSSLLETAEKEAIKRGNRWVSLVSMYYRFRYYKNRGYQTCPRKQLPPELASCETFKDPAYMKCAVMYKEIV